MGTTTPQQLLADFLGCRCPLKTKQTKLTKERMQQVRLYKISKLHDRTSFELLMYSVDTCINKDDNLYWSKQPIRPP